MTPRLAEVVPADDAGQVRLLVRNDEPLDRLLCAGIVTQREYLAARRYAETWHAAGMCPPLAGDWDGSFDRAGDGAPMERQTAAQARALRAWRRAREAMPMHTRAEVDGVVLWWEEPRSRRCLIAGLRALVGWYNRGKNA